LKGPHPVALPHPVAQPHSRPAASALFRIRGLPLERLEELAEALLDFQGSEDLMVWRAAAD
jgi:hypothetical protein